MQVPAFTLKERMRLYLKHDIKITRRPAVGTNITLFLIANPCAIFHASRYAHVDHVLFHRAALAFALAAWIRNHAPISIASRAWPGNAEHGLLIADLPATGARWTSAGASISEERR